MTIRRIRPVLLLASFVLAGCAGASTDWAADREEIRAALEASQDGWNRGDLDGHLAIYADTTTFMTGEGPRPGVDAIAEAFRRTYFTGDRPDQMLRFDRLAIRPLDDDAALATGRFTLSGGGQPDQSGWFTLVWVRTTAGWRVVHDHSS